MIKLYLLTCFIIFSFSLHAQNDFFILKKKDKTIQQYYADKYIYCELVNGEWVSGFIKKITNDSVFIGTFHVNYLPTIWGTLMPDTVKDASVNIPVKDIYAFPAKEMNKVHAVPSGLVLTKALQYGGAGFIALNVVNNLADKDAVFRSSNIPNLVGGAVAFIIGKILQKLYCPTILFVGKKYHIEYMGNTSSQ